MPQCERFHCILNNLSFAEGNKCPTKKDGSIEATLASFMLRGMNKEFYYSFFTQLTSSHQQSDNSINRTTSLFHVDGSIIHVLNKIVNRLIKCKGDI